MEGMRVELGGRGMMTFTIDNLLGVYCCFRDVCTVCALFYTQTLFFVGSCSPKVKEQRTNDVKSMRTSICVSFQVLFSSLC